MLLAILFAGVFSGFVLLVFAVVLFNLWVTCWFCFAGCATVLVDSAQLLCGGFLSIWVVAAFVVDSEPYWCLIAVDYSLLAVCRLVVFAVIVVCCLVWIWY